MVRLEVEATLLYRVPETLMAVDEAYGKSDASPEVAVNEPAKALKPRSDDPATLSIRHGVEVPMPRLPVLVKINRVELVPAAVVELTVKRLRFTDVVAA